MKRSFTFFELIIVIVVIGILAAVTIPRLGTDSLSKATTVFIDTLRFAQHLALVDDKYIPSKELSSFSNPTKKKKDTKFWFKKWWIFYINDKNDHPILVVFSDKPSGSNNNEYNVYPYHSEIAYDGATGKKKMGKAFNGTTDKKYIDKKLDLYSSFGVQKVIIDSPCRHYIDRLSFDELGRPHCLQTKSNNNDLPYINIAKSKVKYTLCKDSDCEENTSVCVEANSGFIHRCN